ncbi:MAG TPA: hypothetical protein VF069_13725 [Streptosporangiaceae bacterium]
MSGPNRSFSERLQRWRGHQPGIDHGPGADWLALLEDQQSIHQDFACAVVLVLAQERPDLLVKAAHNIFSDQSSGVDRSSRGYILLLMILSDAVRHAKQRTSDDAEPAVSSSRSSACSTAAAQETRRRRSWRRSRRGRLSREARRVLATGVPPGRSGVSMDGQ